MAKFKLVPYTVFEIIALFGIFFNSGQISLMIRHENTKIPFDISVLGLCFADLFSVMIWLLIYIYRHLLENKVVLFSREYVFIICSGGFFVLASSSLFHTLFIAIQRVFAVFFPRKFRIYFTRGSCFACLVFIWLVSFVAGFLATRYNFYKIFSVCVLACGGLLVVCSIIICLGTYRQSKTVSSMSVSARGQNRSNKRTIIYCIIITMLYVFSTFPIAILLGWIDSRDDFYLETAALWLMELNPVFNSLLYFTFNKCKQIKNWSDLLCCCDSQRQNRVNRTLARRSTVRSDIELTEIQREPRSSVLGRGNASYVAEH